MYKGALRLPLLGFSGSNATAEIEFYETHRYTRLHIPAFGITVIHRFTGFDDALSVCRHMHAV